MAVAEKILQPRLETERLILEPFQDSDLPDIFAYASDAEITRFLTWPSHQSIEDSKAFLNWTRSNTCNDRDKLCFIFGIRLKQSGKILGSFSFTKPMAFIGQIDYALSRDFWGQGLVPEAARVVRDWALEKFPEIVRFQAYCQPENEASAKVMQKIGMSYEGIRRQSFLIRGKYVDLAHYAWVRGDSLK